MPNIDQQLARARRVIKYAAFGVLGLALTWTSVAVLSGSVGLLAKGIDSITDLIAIISVYLGLWLAKRRPTQRYPYGYFKAETLAALIVAVFIFITGIGVLWEAFQRILHPPPLQNIGLALIISIITLPIIRGFSWYLKKVGKATGSKAVYNTGQEFQMDILASIAVILGLLFTFFGFYWAEPIVGFLIGLFILKGSFQLAYESILILMDAGQDPDQINQIKQLTQPIQGVLGVHAIKLRRAGPICFGEMHLEVAGKVTVLQSHRLAEEIASRVKEAYPDVISFLVHVEPVQPVTFRVALPVDSEEAQPNSSPSIYFEDAPFFIIMDIDRGEIRLWEVMPNTADNQKKIRAENTAQILIDAKVEIVIAEKMNEIPLNILRNHLIYVFHQNSEMSCYENVQAYLADELRALIPVQFSQTLESRELV
ncbi:MAG: cation diffusion facilitator family transporter [Candidatus Thorarchaeota archaeon]